MMRQIRLMTLAGGTFPDGNSADAGGRPVETRGRNNLASKHCLDMDRLNENLPALESRAA
jgi:hypothetical protein